MPVRIIFVLVSLLTLALCVRPRHSIGEEYHPIAYGRRVLDYPPDNEIQALKYFFADAGGTEWITSTGWLVGNPCDWFGVVCNATTSSVSAILLSGNNLAGKLTPSISVLTSLEVLDISFNAFSDTIPPSTFANMPFLREIYLNNNAFYGNLSFMDHFPPQMDVIYLPENAFTGTIPQSIGRFSRLYNFQMFSNNLEGTIPDSIGDATALQFIDFGFNYLDGTLPESIGNISALEYFWIYDDDLVGTLPSSIGNLQNLLLFEITRNGFYGDIPDSFSKLKSLESLRMGGNNLSGVPTAICSMVKLTEAFLYSNAFTGLPPCDDIFNLSILLMSNNLLTGDIPEALGSLRGLKKLDFSHNEITGTIPKSFANLEELIMVDCSHNNITATLSDMLVPLSRLPRITVADFSYNNLYGGIPYEAVWDDSTQEELSKEIAYMYLNNNNLSGDLPEYLSWFFRLIYLDLSYNNFTGPIPESLAYLRQLYLEGNQYMEGVDGGALPSFLQPDYKLLKKSDDGTYACPGLVGSDNEYQITIDPSYYNYSFCRCEINYFGVNGSCTACPAHCSCPGAGTEIIVKPGYYPYPDFYTPTHLLKCSKDNFGFTPCNPDSVFPFQCKTGYEGRLCSKCSEDYFSRGIECVKCLDKGKRITVFVFLTVLVLATYSFFLLTKPVVSLPSAARKTAMFYFQALNLLLTRFAGWPAVFSFLSSVSSGFNFGFNFTCVVFDYYQIFYVTLFIPLYCFMLNCSILALAYLLKITKVYELNLKKLKHGATRVFIIILNFMYLPLCTLILSMFVCLEDEYNGKMYLAVAPYLQCRGDKTYAAAVSFAAIGFVVYALGIPALFSYILWSNRNSLQDRNVLNSVGCLYVDYTEESHYYELVGLGRRFLFALVIAVVKQDNLFLMSTILFSVLIANAGFQIKIRPFNYRISNILEMTGIAILCFNLVAILGSTSRAGSTSVSTNEITSSASEDNAELVVMQVLVLFINLVYILGLIAALFFGVSQLVLPKRWRKKVSNMQGIKSVAFLAAKQTQVFDLALRRGSAAPPFPRNNSDPLPRRASESNIAIPGTPTSPPLTRETSATLLFRQPSATGLTRGTSSTHLTPLNADGSGVRNRTISFQMVRNSSAEANLITVSPPPASPPNSAVPPPSFTISPPPPPNNDKSDD